jgi:hypothetical protein
MRFMRPFLICRASIAFAVRLEWFSHQGGAQLGPKSRSPTVPHSLWKRFPPNVPSSASTCVNTIYNQRYHSPFTSQVKKTFFGVLQFKLGFNYNFSRSKIPLTSFFAPPTLGTLSGPASMTIAVSMQRP